MEDWRSYDSVAERYERVTAPRLSEPARDLVEATGVAPGLRVLDVGTGTGVAAGAAAARLGGQGLVVGVDVSLPMLRFARARPGVLVAAARAFDLPFRDGTFDVVLASFVISHFPRPETGLFDMLRVLRSGGRLGVTNRGPGEDDLRRTWRELVEAAVGSELARSAVHQAVPWEERFADRPTLEEALERSGLRRVRSELRRYRFRYTIEEFVEERAASATGRFVREMLGEAAFAGFLERARAAYRERFADPLTDLREVVLAVGTKP
ncbi:MAG TPA: methyltransferase domain-containing protein [Actinomycetota bacterium]|nr:methyltransferase domain-containing protein [Actinomycetota bacterium]